MNILVTGANGMVARAAAEYCRAIGDEVTALTHQQLDIADRTAVEARLRDLRPDAVLNCAAFTDVDGAETRRDECFAANARGPENLARACREAAARFVTVSSDYVFDGRKEGFYVEGDTPNPQSAYARSKLEGERLVEAANKEAVVIRSGWIFGAGGTNFLSEVPSLLRSGTRIKAILDSWGTPTFAGDLARRMREFAAADLRGIFHVTNAGDGTTYLEFAETAAEIGGFDRSLIEPVSLNDLKRPAMRPKNSRLASERLAATGFDPLQDWTDALRSFIEKEKAAEMPPLL